MSNIHLTWFDESYTLEASNVETMLNGWLGPGAHPATLLSGRCYARYKGLLYKIGNERVLKFKENFSTNTESK